jgi:hypothetical protein
MRTLTCPPETETIGVNITAFFDNLRDANTKPIMEKYGLLNIDPESWFPASKYLDALNELGQNPDFSSNLVAIGLEVGSMTPLPPDLENPTLEEVLMRWDDMYQMLHRGADVGGVVIEKISDTHYKTTHTVIYPDDMSYGVLYGYGRRFLPPGTRFKVYYDPDVLPRDMGGQEGCTIIHITWE